MVVPQGRPGGGKRRRFLASGKKQCAEPERDACIDGNDRGSDVVEVSLDGKLSSTGQGCSPEGGCDGFRRWVVEAGFLEVVGRAQGVERCSRRGILPVPVGGSVPNGLCMEVRPDGGPFAVRGRSGGDPFASWRNATATPSVRVDSLRTRLPANVEELPARTR